jgi:Deoxyribonuclease NucA/NucB
VGTYVIIDTATKTKLKECADSARSGENKCKPDFAVFMVGDDYNEVRDHIGDAFTDFKPRFLSRKSPAWSRGWLEKYKGPGKPCNGGPGTDCDEYPFAASMEGGSGGDVSIRSVNAGQNRGAGSQLRWFYDKCNIPPNNSGKKYGVIAIRGLDTGYVCSR